MKRHLFEEADFGPDTDLAMSLLAILLCAVAFMTEKRGDLEGEVEAKQIVVQQQRQELDEERQARAAKEGELEAAKQRQLRTASELEQEQSRRARTEGERNAAREEAGRERDERRRQAGAREQAEKEGNVLRSTLSQAQSTLREANARLDRSMELRLKTIDAPLIVEIDLENVPTDADADIHVQDPDDNVTSWCFKPAQSNGKQVTGLVKSESLALPPGVHREAFYASETTYRAGRPYIVGCMLYRDQQVAKSVTVKGTWKVTAVMNGKKQSRTGTFSMSSTGTVTTNRSFSGLRNFLTLDIVDGELRVNTENVPDSFRGWINDTSGIKTAMTKPEK